MRLPLNLDQSKGSIFKVKGETEKCTRRALLQGEDCLIQFEQRFNGSWFD